ncbi:MAG: hypothetical protein WBB45_11295 [Cyclobacteriaceae bacterium]
MKNTSLTLLIVLTGSLLNGCFLFGSDDDQRRKGHFGCLVNGEPFVSCYPRAHADYTVFGIINIGADFYDSNSTTIFVIKPYEGEVRWFEYPDVFMDFIYNKGEKVCNYRLINNVQGYVNVVQFNPFDEYISGTFEYTAVNEACDTVKVTDGRFDLSLVW